MTYTLPRHIDSNKIFLVNKKDIEQRFDPKSILFLGNKMKSCIYDNIQLKNIAFIRKGTAITSDEIDSTGIYPVIAGGQTSPYKHSKYNYRGNVITISASGAYAGYVWYHKSPIFASDCSVIYSKDENSFLTNYIYLVLKIQQDYIYILQTGAAQPHVYPKDLARLWIPLPPKDKQQQIIDLYNTAYNQKKAKEQQAKELLSSIDEYLLNELGITLPNIDNSLSSRIFIVNSKEISNSRFDPKKYSKYYKELKNNIKRTLYNSVPLNNFIVKECDGDWGEDINTEFGNKDKFLDCLVIRATEIDNEYNLNLENSRVKHRLISKDKFFNMNILENDLLIEKSGGSDEQPVGRVAIIDKDVLQTTRVAFSNFLHKISVVNINPFYLYYYLKTINSIGLTDCMQSQTNGIRNLIMKEYKEQLIPLPPLEKQKDIADHITEIRQKAKQLQEEAVQLLQQTKKETEQMILE